jgi:LacI family transcriptional regulator
MVPGSNISDVAALAGVSETTVSHAISGRRPVSAKTHAKVQAAIDQLGWRPNRLASGMRRQQTHTIALVIRDISNPFFPVLSRGLQDGLRVAGYQVFICSTDGNADLEESFLADAIDRQVDGIVFNPTRSEEVPVALLASSGIPIVLISGDANAQLPAFQQPGLDIVRSNNELGMQNAVEHLLSRGHARIGLINGEPDSGPAHGRAKGYQDGLLKAGIAFDPTIAVSTSFDRAGGVLGLTQLLGMANPPSAVVCGNDLIAIGALDVARERGLDVPGDLAVVGYDDIDAASLVVPSLTTVLNPAREIGQTAGSLLLDRMSGEYNSHTREVTIANPLIVRSSS